MTGPSSVLAVAVPLGLLEHRDSVVLDSERHFVEVPCPLEHNLCLLDTVEEPLAGACRAYSCIQEEVVEYMRLVGTGSSAWHMLTVLRTPVQPLVPELLELLVEHAACSMPQLAAAAEPRAQVVSLRESSGS